MKRLSIIGCALALSFMLSPALALADVVVVVARENPVTTLTHAQLADIYLGRLSRFPNGGSVVPIDQKEGADVRAEFYSEYLGRSPAQIKAHWSKLIFTGRGQPPRSVADGPAMIEFIAEHPDAIGYMDSDHVNDDVRIVSIE
ncbi:MAG: phosphate ABC transporter substrate-binding protein [Wenzhouxiangellaceae bacterium]